jgi:hypothetical protein
MQLFWKARPVHRLQVFLGLPARFCTEATRCFALGRRLCGCGGRLHSGAGNVPRPGRARRAPQQSGRCLAGAGLLRRRAGGRAAVPRERPGLGQGALPARARALGPARSPARILTVAAACAGIPAGGRCARMPPPPPGGRGRSRGGPAARRGVGLPAGGARRRTRPGRLCRRGRAPRRAAPGPRPRSRVRGRSGAAGGGRRAPRPHPPFRRCTHSLKAFESKRPACDAGRRTGKLPVAVLSGFLGAGCGARLARAAAARARAGLTRAARAAQEEHAAVAPPGEPERPAGAPALRAAPCLLQRRRATHRRRLVFRQLFGSTYGSK